MTTVPTIFYTDDDEDDLFIFKEAARNILVRIEIFNLGDKLMFALHNPPPFPAIIFIDLNMPGISGYDYIEQIRSFALLENLPIVVLSTASDPVTIERCKKIGVNYYITKPTSMQLLTKSIEFALRIEWENFNPSLAQFHHKH
ncbi:response regulator [Flavobacterium noncentrifugens]|nr:response regulator [Flavobacterium noncentrifugens]GEP51150.1 response regulator [Flavobacterium noncentrifugens]